MAAWTFVRHGQSRANAEGWLAGAFDSPLTARGRAQAEAARAALDGLRVSRTFTSDLSRAVDTARIILAGRRVTTIESPALRERHCGVLERRSIAELDAVGIMSTLAEWSARPPGGESLRDVALRAVGWLAREDDGRDALVVAHGALIRAVLGVFDGRPHDQIGSFRPANCQAIRRDIPRGGWAELHRAITSSA